MAPDINRPRPLRFALLAPAVLVGALVTVAVAPGSAQDQPATRMFRPGSESGQSSELRGETVPSKEMDLAFAVPGRVAEVAIKEGDVVEAGQLLMQQDVAADQALLKS